MRKLVATLVLCTQFFGCGKDAQTNQNSQEKLQISQSRGISKLSSASESLIMAIKSQDHILVKTALANQADPNYVSYEGERAIIIAARLGDAQIVNTLILHGANPNLTDEKENYALIEAVSNNNLGALKAIITKIDNINVLNSDNENALIVALKKNNQIMTNLLIKSGINTLVKDSQGRRPIEIASSKNLKLSQKLIKDVTVIRRKGVEQAQLISLIQEGAFDTLDYITRFHNIKDYLSGANYIMAVLDNEDKISQTKILRLLLDNKVNPNGENEDTFVPIITTVKEGNLYATRLLFQYGADLNKQDNYNVTAIAYAARNLNVEMVNFLYAYGAQVEYTFTDDRGRSMVRDVCKYVPKKRFLSTPNRQKKKQVESRLGCD